MTSEEIKQYFTGKWYELVRTDVIFEKGCSDATAEYQYGDVVQIVNTCTKTDKDKKKSTRLRATKHDTETDVASFDVGLTRAETGRYNILYNRNGVAVVAGSKWRSFWLLSRDKDLPHAEICAVLEPFFPYLRDQTLVYNDGEPCVEKPRRVLRAIRRIIRVEVT